MGTKENAQEMTETQVFDLPQNGFQLTDHPWCRGCCIVSISNVFGGEMSE